MQRAEIIRQRLRAAALTPAVKPEVIVPELKSQSRVNPPELLPLTQFKGREEDRLKLIYGIVGAKRPLTEDERKEIARLQKSLRGEDTAAKRPDYDLADFEKEFLHD